jgi:hypothetical protein
LINLFWGYKSGQFERLLGEHYALKMKNFSIFFLVLLFFYGCGQSTNVLLIPIHKPFVDANETIIKSGKTNFEPFFAPWRDANKSEYLSAYNYFEQMPKKQVWYKENLAPYTQNELTSIIAETNGDKWLDLPQNGIIIRNSDLRCVPSKRPFFEDFALAGEGYPFDYAQNSRIYIGTPIKLLKISLSKEFYFVQSSVGYGWVDSRNIATTDIKFENNFQNAAFVAPMMDKTAITDKDSGLFVESLNIGTILPSIKGVVYYPNRTKDGSAKLLAVAENAMFGTLPMKLSPKNISLVALASSGGTYGWGGLLDNRDCSMFLRDIFVNFGLFLPRNSADQALGYTDLSKMDKTNKKTYIKSHAKPWQTVIYMKGHIMLYVGIDANGEPIAIHDAWGVKSFDKMGNEGRAILGGVVVTTLEEGKGESWFDDEKSSHLLKIKGIKDLF